jgi:hypothetical protein
MTTPIQLPTATSIKLRFPEFDYVPDAVVEFSIEEASRLIDSTWAQGDQLLACSYLAAHIMMISIQRAESGTGQLVTSETIGRLVTTYATQEMPKTGEESDFAQTPYGVRFVMMARRNFPAVAII